MPELYRSHQSQIKPDEKNYNKRSNWSPEPTKKTFLREKLKSQNGRGTIPVPFWPPLLNTMMVSSVKNFAISPSAYISVSVFCQVTKVYAYGNIRRNGKACLVEFVLYLKNIDDKSNHLQYLNGNLSYCNFYTRV